MSRSIKWILAIGIGLVLVAAIAVAGFFVVSRLHFPTVMVGPRAFQFWEGRRAMPMQPFQRMPYSRFGGISLLPLLGRGLIFAGFLALIFFGVIALIFALTRSSQKPAAALSTYAQNAAPGQAPAATAQHHCPNCDRQVQQDWSHCPYCGTALTGTPPSNAAPDS